MMFLSAGLSAACALLALPPRASAVSVAEINGLKYRTSFVGANADVTDVQGIVTAKDRQGIFIRGVERILWGNSLYIYDETLAANTSIVPGDIITLDGKVAEYRSGPEWIFLTEIKSPKVKDLVKGGPEPEPWVIGLDTPNPPTEQYSALDFGDVFAIPNNQSLISNVNPDLDPTLYGMDFWQSLSGELVTIRQPVAVSRPQSSSHFTWVVGGWPTTGRNSRGGLTMTNRGL